MCWLYTVEHCRPRLREGAAVTFRRWAAGIVIATLLFSPVSPMKIGGELAQALSLPSSKVCGSGKEPVSRHRGKIRDAIYSRKEKAIAYHCNDFIIKIEIVFIAREKRYQIKTDLENDVRFAANPSAISREYLSERGDELSGFSFSPVPGLSPIRSVPDLGSDAKELLREVGRVVQTEVRKIVADCPGPRDHRKDAVVKCHLSAAIRDHTN